MSTTTKLVPGKVHQNGIVSRENLTPTNPIISSPAHFPDFACVTPRGPIGRATVAMSGFSEKFGDIQDPNGPYYNPVAVAIGVLGKAGQASFSFRRLTANEEHARVIMGVILFEGQDVPNYERNAAGGYEFDDAGKPIVDKTTPTVKGVVGFPAILKASPDTPVGKANSFEVNAVAGGTLPDDAKGKFYPLFELVGGVGDAYNAMYAAFGNPSFTDWTEVARFVITYGAFPFVMNIGERLDNGMRIPATTVSGTPDAQFTLYNMADNNNVRYGVQVALDRFTGRDVNRPVQERPAPFTDAFVYNTNIDTVCAALYKAEYVDGVGVAPEVLSNKLPVRAIMNPFSFVDHNGNPYHHVVFGGNTKFPGDKLEVSRVSMNHYFQASGGVDPYALANGDYPAAPDSWIEAVDGPWVTKSGTDELVSHKQFWAMNQILIEGYLTSYRGSLDVKDVIRNRTSFMWDLGYNDAIKDLLISFLGKRKDIIVVPCATEYLVNKSQEQLYSTREALHTKIAMIPESETFQSHACRSAINLWTGRVIDEPTFSQFSLNIETMYAFAIAGGGEDGKVYANLMPDNEGNRTLRVMHDPLVQFEDDDPAANNLIQGSITVTPLNTSQFCRPALPTVYNSTESVLKDLPNVWACICVEKILQDEWIKISGNTQLRREGYIARLKDAAEARIREQLGAVIVNYSVDPTFREDSPNAKSVMFTTTRLWFSKGVYMMDSTLEAYNEDSLATQ
ncbi:hypothetical protein D6_0264 [Aeromonas phage D6]|uniref:Tail sheath protein n=1 Tax=Aeromonas phage D6 TaxID=2593322 RepID=A0A514TWP0_9CAUD|nr:tail sheath [Aeromonas phage D6]QDJ97423.1 hypothetical protein D6_0264 [Aeromonas phage D6]